MTLKMKRVRGFSFDAKKGPFEVLPRCFRPTVPVDGIGLAMDQHKVLEATTCNGERYALDITGAQFGFYEAILPWKEYVDLHVCEVQSRDGEPRRI